MYELKKFQNPDWTYEIERKDGEYIVKKFEGDGDIEDLSFFSFINTKEKEIKQLDEKGEVHFMIYSNARKAAIYHYIKKQGGLLKGEAFNISRVISLVEDVQEVMRDPLTGMGNEESFYFHLQNAAEDLSDNQKIGVIVVSIDHFRSFRQKMGQEIAEIVLRDYARKIEACLRKKGDVVARIDEKEFGILLPNIDDVAVIETVAERIYEEVEKPIMINAVDVVKAFRLTLSMGACVAEEKELQLREVLSKAYEMLEQVKRDTKNDLKVFGY